MQEDRRFSSEEAIDFVLRGRVEPPLLLLLVDILLGRVDVYPIHTAVDALLIRVDVDPICMMRAPLHGAPTVKRWFHDATTITIPSYRKSVYLFGGCSDQHARIKMMMKFTQILFMV